MSYLVRFFSSSVVALLLCFNVNNCHASSECASIKILKQNAGHYAPKDFWNNLPITRDWFKTSSNTSLTAINIHTNGDVEALLGWHEHGSKTCVQFRGNELWAKDINGGVISSKWTGPFIRVSSNQRNDTPYFNRIFGNQCFKSNKNEKWCFGPGIIKIDSKIYKTDIFTDDFELPKYGNPVSSPSEQGFWFFVPYKNGWKVFQDSFLTDEDNENIDPKKSKPWRILTP